MLTLFGLFYQGVPASLNSALGALPDSGIDATFIAQVMNGVLAHSRASLEQVLTTAIAANVLSASYAAVQGDELNRIDALRTLQVAKTPYIRGKTPLGDLLAAGNVTDSVKTAFVTAYASNGGQLGPTWKALRTDKSLPADELATLETTLSLGELLTGNLPLVKDTLNRLSQKTLAGVQQLALLDENDWIARITELDPDATSISQVLPADTAQQRIARFAKALTARFARRYPSVAFAGGLTKSAASSFKAKPELIEFLTATANSTFNIRHSNIDRYIATNKVSVSADALGSLKAAQRLYRISPDYASVEALHSAGYTSAQSVYFKGRRPFLAEMTQRLGSASFAKMAYARAQMTYATALMAFGRYNLQFNGLGPASMQSAVPDPKLLSGFPDLQALFGSLDYFQCDDCQSVYSPAAYLVDLLQYLKGFSGNGGGVSNARDALFLRRPDIQYLALNCNNTNITLPYIDLVNELLEGAITPPATPVTLIETIGTSSERRALPQQISQIAYDLTAKTVFPISLPFDLPFAQTTAYVAALGSTRAAILSLFAGSPISAVLAPSIAAASLGINPAMQKVINGTDMHQAWEWWGFAQHPANVIDPKTRTPYVPNPVDWVAALSKVPLLLNRAGLSLQQLYQLLETIWVTQSSVTLKLGTTTTGGVQIVESDTDAMAFTGLTADVLSRANRFLRLWNASGLPMWELDWALEAAAAGKLDDSFIVFLEGAMSVQKRLKLAFQEVLTFWMPLQTRDVINHLGDEDTIVPSTYSEVFRNPAVLASWSSIFSPVGQNKIAGASNTSPISITTALPHRYKKGQRVSIVGALGNTAANGTFTITVTGPTSFTLDGSAGNGPWTSDGIATGLLSGNPIFNTPPTTPTAEQNAIASALALSADDISAILAFTGASKTLSLDTLNVLLRYQRLANALALDIPSLILWVQLTKGKPFGGAPADTLEFLRRLAVLQATGIAVRDLDYLLRAQSSNQSSLTFTSLQGTTVLQAIRDAIAKLPGATTIAITGASNATPITITTAKAHGLKTGTQLTIIGALGNTAANGTFTITVTNPTSFTLNGSVGSGNWTSGGVINVPTYDATAIQTIFITTLAAATGTSANVVSPVLAQTGVLPLDSKTIALLVAQTPSVDPSQFPALIRAFTSIAKSAALFAALKPTETTFTFVIQNAAVFNWLDPSELPITSRDDSPYDEFEALLRLLKLNQRQPARAPKMVDVLGSWLPPNPLPPDLATAIAGPSLSITAASNASPIAIITASAHGLQTGIQVVISHVTGNTAANGTFTITVTGTSSFTLNGSAGNGAWAGGGVANVPGLAVALNASVGDVASIANALGAKNPSLTAGSQPGSLADVAMIAAIAAALDVAARYGMSGPTLVQLSSDTATADTAAAARGALQAQYAQSAWFAAIQPVEDALRTSRRDALVAYLLGPGAATSAPLFLTADDIFNYYLIDPEMSACALMTRLLQASLAIQQFVQQCFLNLFFFSSNVTIDMSNAAWNEWSWRKQYRLWQANREVFLYPENYVLPELRKDASSFFTDLKNDMQQSSYTADTAEAATENYLRKLLGVARLHVAAHYNETKADGSTVLHVFARTKAAPAQWYYRTRTSHTSGTGSWSAWQLLNLDIASDHLIPVIWDRRLHLVWPIFKQISEKQTDQTVPSSGGGGRSSAPKKFWAVQFAMSEFSAGQWQAKRTIGEKLYFNSEDPPIAFSFRASEDSSFNLQIQVYLVVMLQAIDVAFAVDEAIGSAMDGGALRVIDTSGMSTIVAKATLPLPESRLTVTEVPALLPRQQYIDPSQEPTYAFVATQTMWGSLATPLQYGTSGQDLVYGDYTQNTSGQVVPLNVLWLNGYKAPATSVELLGTIADPRIIIPVQEPVFDSADPFFVADRTRTYLVVPEYFTVSSSPQELFSLNYVGQWQTRYVFETFYHPYARTFLRELEIGGISQLMSRNLQLNPQAVRGWAPSFDFNALYKPQPPVAAPYPGTSGAPDPGETSLDFAPGSSGAYSLYNWEVFYHIPMFMASLLLRNRQFKDALTWLEYIFNPTDNSGGPSPQRFWQMAPFNAMNSADWISQQIQTLLSKLAADSQQGISDPATTAAIQNWIQDPFDPHAIASLRISAYGKATVMRMLDVLLGWGDWYYGGTQYTVENVSQAEQLYIVADMILGPKPDAVRAPNSQSNSEPVTYAALKDIDAFSNVLVPVENLVVAPEPPSAIVQGTADTASPPQFPALGNTLLFCIPPNEQLLAYWEKVATRLYNIRHCLNIRGVAQPPALYAPPLNPLQLIEAAQGGEGVSGATQAAPIYRFSTYLQKAIELTNDVRNYGALILSALEKQDAETLETLRANQELDIQTRMLDVKNLQATEAQDQISALQNQQAVVQIRYKFYSSIAFMNGYETAAIALQGYALIANGLGVILDMASGEAHLIPSFSIGIAGFGGSPNVSMSFGGENIAGAVASQAGVARGIGGLLSQAGMIASTMGSYQRRMDDWNLQAQLASAELTQLGSQIAAATDRLDIANKEISIQNAQISNAQALSDFLTNKYTNAQLYNWMISQLTTVYAQAYQLAFSLALQAENAFQYELGNHDSFIEFGYWNSQHSGLTAGDSLLFDLRRMESQYLAENSRELELTKNISLAITNPTALVMLRETGSCQITLDEAAFEYDHPGQYFRRFRAVALTIPCVTGPYTGVNATLSLTSAMVRTKPPDASYKSQKATTAPNDPSVIVSPIGPEGTVVIATSSGQNDPGLFEDNLNEERWRPFEGQGVISTFNLVLDPRDNNFDFATITDVVIHIRFSARGGGDLTAAQNVRAALKPQTARSILISTRSTFGDAFYTFFNPLDTTATQELLTLPMTAAVFPFSNLGSVKIDAITFYVVLSVPAAGNTIAANFGPSGGTSSALSLAPAPGQTSTGDAIAALTATATLAPSLAAPQTLVLTVPAASVSPGLAITVAGQTRLDPSKIEDILLVANYSIG
ncbi:hypothetical protein C9I57_25210 [Trinickia symbiotica]|uniref:Toxin n=1 Tax=Trinickia symbiotica TaxID=863227 RepID=A0A2T3XNN2_9BURK|nr:neuraminidase-like domain-containing protein [Trinickia symbiotica]PTB18124.1 hypothetical protein C9I57_25210 [Trinickia symbiotica]